MPSTVGDWTWRVRLNHRGMKGRSRARKAWNSVTRACRRAWSASPWMAEIGRWFMELKGDTGGHLLMWLLILGIAVLGAGFFVLTRYLLKNHLNLE